MGLGQGWCPAQFGVPVQTQLFSSSVNCLVQRVCLGLGDPWVLKNKERVLRVEQCACVCIRLSVMCGKLSTYLNYRVC